MNFFIFFLFIVATVSSGLSVFVCVCYDNIGSNCLSQEVAAALSGMKQIDLAKY